MKNTIPKLIIIGLGNQGSEHYNAAKLLESRGRLKIVGLCDPAISADKFPAESQDNIYQDYREAVKEKRPDMAIISVPNSLYLDIIDYCAKHKVSILKEKPLATTPSEARKMKKIVEEEQIFLKVAQQRFYHPHFRLVKSWLKDLGDLKYFDYKFSLNDLHNSWYWKKSEGGGALFGLGWHGCSLVNWFFGNPKTVASRLFVNNLRKWSYETDDTSVVQVTYKNGGFGRMLMSVIYPQKAEEIYIVCEKGAIFLSRKSVILLDKEGNEIQRSDCQYSWEDTYVSQIEDFIELVLIGQKGIDSTANETMNFINNIISSEGLGGNKYNLEPQNLRTIKDNLFIISNNYDDKSSPFRRIKGN